MTTRRRIRPGDAILHIWGALGLLFLFFPIVVIVVYSFNSGRSLQTFDGFSVEPYVAALSNPAIINSITVSVITAAGTAVVATILGTSAGIALARRPRWWAPGLLTLLGLVMVTPEIVSAISLLPWFVTLGIDWGITGFNIGQVRLIIANSLFACAVVTFIVRARMTGMNESLEEAAADLYATPLRRFTDVTLPLIRPAVIAGALLAFTLSLDNTVVSSFVSVAGSTPWPVYIFASLKAALRPEIAAMSTLMLVLTLIVLGVAALILRRDPTGTGGGAAGLTDAMVGR
ncbi:ABC transporter permease [Mycolicibacterium cosmeticum]|uniref:ABC-type spermidine/putrescine transport system, permease component II n=1 Tax=Mycolicibacterium cosmeticum TaxID=258533 RepID=W9BIL4_MYCCO|nr:ABC transporter permease [Mycolicibacterium cosmeticum]TLH69336.1 ABC transporter permease [Mycolicibacterium cosmeticum]CDO06600.1 ABC-type spermidine/putrescine transport system, permease component II [Mycolicibacterium cosmeticum]